jgi:hypothetical protein
MSHSQRVRGTRAVDGCYNLLAGAALRTMMRRRSTLAFVLAAAACQSSSNEPPPAGALDPSMRVTTLDGFTTSGVEPLGAVASGGDALVVWTSVGVRARASGPDGTWAAADEIVDADASGIETASDLVATSSEYTVVRGRVTGNGAEALAVERGLDGRWQPPVTLGPGLLEDGDDPGVPRPVLVSDELGLAAVWPGPVEGPGRTLLSAARVDGAWRPAVTAVAGDFVTAYSPADGAGGVLVARVSVSDTLANDVGLVHSAADAWTVAGALASGSAGDVWGPGAGSRVAALEWIDTGSIYNNGVLRYMETRATDPSPPDEDLNVAGPYKRGWTVTWKALASGEVLAVYGTTDWNDGSMVTYFQRRSAEGAWSAPWSVTQATVAAIAGDDGGGWTLASTQVQFSGPWQLRLRRFSVAGTGTYGPDVLVTEGQLGGQPQARLYLHGDRVLVVATYLVPTADPSTFDDAVLARWFEASE